jgi:hypothetical protein
MTDPYYLHIMVTDTRLVAPGSVIEKINWIGARSAADLVIDQAHPFFFDHPLDHVPGMLLCAGLLDLIRDTAVVSGSPAGNRIRISLKFTKICGLDRNVELQADSGSDGWAVRAIQDDAAVCEGYVHVATEDEPPPPRAVPPVNWVRPISASLVHRADSRNVMVGEPFVYQGLYVAPVITPAPGHFVLRGNEEYYSTEEVIESGRQLATALSHLAHGRSSDARLVWVSLTADLPVTHRRVRPLALRWQASRPHGTVGLFKFALVHPAARQPVGSLSYLFKACQ